MSKKSPLVFLEQASKNTKKSYKQSIGKYESFHGMTIDELVCEALQEQGDRVPEHELKIYDRLYDFKVALAREFKYHTVLNHYNRITRIYRMNRVRIPFIPPLNPKTMKRSPVIEYDDILTKDEIKKAIPFFNEEERIRVMAMVTGGFSNAEASSLTKEQFFEELKPYHQCDDYHEAMEKLAEMDNVIWVARLERQKTKKPYYGLVNPETVQAIAQVRMGDDECTGRLFEVNPDYFGNKCREISRNLKLGVAGDRERLTPHSLRRFHATHIKGSVLSYEEQLSLAQVDELQGRGKTKTQDAYMKTSKLEQKVLYAKVMNNISLYNTYEYEIIDGDVVVHRVDSDKKIRKLAEENDSLRKKLRNSGDISPQLKNFIEDVGLDNFVEQLSKLSDSL